MGRNAAKHLAFDDLESRALLHGGGFGGFGHSVHGFHGDVGGEVPTVEERVDAILERVDENGDGQIVADEVSERKWDCYQQADADQDGAVTADELNVYITDQLEQRVADKVDQVFARYDTDENGEIDLADLSGRCTGRLADADANQDDLLTTEELTAYLRARYGLDGATGNPDGDTGNPDDGGDNTENVETGNNDDVVVATSAVNTVETRGFEWRGMRRFGRWHH